MNGMVIYDPIVVCSCGVSMHDNQATRDAHIAAWHSREIPAVFHAVDKATAEAAGWTVLSDRAWAC